MNTSVFASETERLSELYDYSVLDTAAEQSFDDLAKLAAHICSAPISLISLVDADRVWFKAKVGLEVSEIPRIDGFCASAIQNETLFIVGDAKADVQLRAHPLVEFAPTLRFYAGAPLITPRGYRLGTLCVMDTVPRKLSEEQVAALQSLARSVVTQLEMRRTNRSYQRAQEDLLGIQERITTLVEQQTKELAKNNISLMELTSQLINAQDDERRRIARELHDSTGQVLVALTMTLSQMQRGSRPTNYVTFQECKDLVALATEEVRSVSYLLHPPLIEEIGLSSAVTEYTKGFAKRSGLQIQVEIAEDLGRLADNREIVLYRILQEGLGNIHRHSGSDTASVKILCVENNVVMEIRDQGKGLSGGAGKGNELNFGVGIKSMKERLRPFGGSLQIESNGIGTSVRAVLPRGKAAGKAAMAAVQFA